MVYALLALQYLASPGEPGDVSARAIAECFEMPLELLAKVLQRHARHGLIAAPKHVDAAVAQVVDAGSVAPAKLLSIPIAPQ